MILPEDGDDSWITICFDFDEVLCEFAYPDIGKPNEDAITWAKELLWEYRVIVYTSRPWAEYDELREWLNKQGLRRALLVCGKPLATVYVDDRAIEYPQNSADYRWKFRKLCDLSRGHIKIMKAKENG